MHNMKAKLIMTMVDGWLAGWLDDYVGKITRSVITQKHD